MCRNANEAKIPVAIRAAVAIAIVREHPRLWDTRLAGAVHEVEQWLDQELTANPDDVALRARVAEFHDMMGNLDRVTRLYKDILDSDSLNSPRERGMILNNLAYAMALNQNTTDEPLQLIDEAIKLLGPTADVKDTRGYIHLVRGETDQAVADFQDALGGGAKTVHKLFHLALALDKQGDEQARDIWVEAIELGLNKYKLPRGLAPAFENLQAKYGT
jgi:tetratricopeptide (TPR) repeat protein